MTFSLSATIAPSKTRIKSTIDIFLAIDSKFGANFLNTIPIISGTVTSINIKIALAITEIFLTSSPKYSAEFITMIGTVTTDIKLIIAVNETDNATSPFAKAVNMLDVTPPGAAAIIITPIANSGAIGHTLIKIKAIIGSKIICEKKPTRKSLGFFITLIKSRSAHIISSTY